MHRTDESAASRNGYPAADRPKVAVPNPGRRHNSQAIRSNQVAIKTDAVGKSYEPVEYVVGTEKIREYTEVTFDTSPLSTDEDAAKAAGYAGLVAPPMFAVVFSSKAAIPAMFDPDVAMNFAMMVHGAQDFTFHKPVVAGDRITTTASVKSITEDGGKGFYVYNTESVNQNGEIVVTADWTCIVRGV
jgi:acyl dehydratase